MKILVIDDEKHIRRLLGDYLRNEGFEVVEGENGYDGINKLIENKDIKLVLLDVRMPKIDGFKTYEEIKRIADIPVIFLTAMDDVQHEVKGLRLGAYDYISKPFSYEILIARVNSCLNKVEEKKPEIIQSDKMIINMTNRWIEIDEEDIGVTSKEFDILELLIHHKNIAVERNKILDRIWGYDYYGDSRTVDTHIKTLRAKMKTYGNMIKTVRGVGYYFEMD